MLGSGMQDHILYSLFYFLLFRNYDLQCITSRCDNKMTENTLVREGVWYAFVRLAFLK
jgi:hypothetical protein